MKNKIVLGLLIVAIAVFVLGIAELVSLKKQPAPVSVTPQPPVATTTQPIPTPPAPQPSQAISPPGPCKVSQWNIATSSWATYRNPQWEIKFQYPSNWTVQEGQLTGGGYFRNGTQYIPANSFVKVSGDGYQLYVKEDDDLRTGEGFEYMTCNPTVAGQGTEMFEDPRSFQESFALTSKNHLYTFYADSPSSSTKQITDTIVNTIGLVSSK